MISYVIIIFICIIFLIVLWFVLDLNIKKIKEIAENKELDELTNSFPENIEVCKSILDKLGNSEVQIKEEKESKTSLYVVVNNTITIANIRDSFTRIQTIAHECIHSRQSKKMLWFNFIYTNIYGLYFIIITILTLLKIIINPVVYLCVLIIMGFVHCVIRSMLETDAMIKARFLAKEYLQENNICSKLDIDRLVAEYGKLNDVGIKLVNYSILAKNILKIIIYSIICIII